MVQTTNRFFDEVARLMNDAAGVAQGVRREFETLFRTQAERFLRDLDVVKREEFEAVKDMARIAREENEALKARMAALEATVKKVAEDAAKEAVKETAQRRRSGPTLRARISTSRLAPAGRRSALEVGRDFDFRHFLFFRPYAAISAATAASPAPLEADAAFSV